MFERIVETAVAAEEAGFDSFWIMDPYHQIANVGAETEPMLEPYTLLAGMLYGAGRGAMPRDVSVAGRARQAAFG